MIDILNASTANKLYEHINKLYAAGNILRILWIASLIINSNEDNL